MIVDCALTILAGAVLCSGARSDDSCLRFGGGSCCPLLKPIGRTIQTALGNQPIYTVLLPKNDETVNIDNDCQTLFPVPDDPDTFIVYVSRVYKNGFNEVTSYILSEPETGVRRLGNGLCQFSDTVFAHLECESDVYLNHRCNIYGGEKFCTGPNITGYYKLIS